MSCSRNEGVLLPVPCSDLSSSKVRPAIVVGREQLPGDLFIVPISSQLPNPDFPLHDWKLAGLNVPCGVKAQLATVEERLVRKVVGKLTAKDQLTLAARLRMWLGL